MKQEQEDAFSFLEEYCENGSEEAIKKGFRWLTDTLLPHLLTTTETYPSEIDLLAESWLLTGEIYELLYAPSKAIVYYEKALSLTPEWSVAHQWMSAIQEQLGDYLAALTHIELAMKYEPSEESLMWDRQRIQDCMVYDKAPDFSEDQLLWKYGELLANQQFDIVIEEVSKQSLYEIDALRCLACAYGGKRDLLQFLLTQQDIKNLDANFIPEEIDLFYQLEIKKPATQPNGFTDF